MNNKLFLYAVLASVFITPVMAATSSSGRGYSGLANAYQTNQRNTYYMVTQPDVDTACRTKIYACLSSYCGDVTVVPGQRESRCNSVSESELYNWTLLCLQKDTDILLPQYGTTTQAGAKGMNTASRLCPSYVQQEVMSYLAMANMANDLTYKRSDNCVSRRRELDAAMTCHDIALAYGNQTSNMLTTQLTDYCGPGIPGGSAEMVQRYSSAGNVGANVWGWAEKIVNLDLSKKGAEWQAAVDSVLATYVNRMNLACGENMQMNTVVRAKDAGPTTLQTAAALAVGMAFPGDFEDSSGPTIDLYRNIYSMKDATSYAEAKQIVQAGLTNNPMTQNPYLTSGEMGNMQEAYKLGTKVFILRDGTRCWIVPVKSLERSEQAVLNQTFSTCVGN